MPQTCEPRARATTASLSVAIAFAVGTVELAGVCTQLAPHGALHRALAELDAHSSALGAGIIGLFALSWLVFAQVARRAAKTPLVAPDPS